MRRRPQSRLGRAAAVLAVTTMLGGAPLVAAETNSARAAADTTTTSSTATSTTAATTTTAAVPPKTTSAAPSAMATGGTATAPTVTLTPPQDRYFYPSDSTTGDDGWYIGASGATTVSASIADSKGNVVATPMTAVPTTTTDFGGQSTTGVSMTWDGTNGGQPVADGTYTVTVTSPDADPVTFQIVVQNEPVGYTISAPAAGSVLHNGDPVTVSAPAPVNGSAAVTSETVTLQSPDDTTGDLGTANPNPDGSFTVASVPGAVPAGTHPVFAAVEFIDPMGWFHSYDTPAVSFDLEGSFDLQSSWTPTVITPNLPGATYGQGQAEIPYTLSVSSTVDAQVLGPDGTTVVADLGPNASVAAGGQFLAWDGTDGKGNQLPSGVYTVALTATAGSASKTLDLKVGLDDSGSLATVTSPAAGDSVSGKGTVTMTVDPNVTPTDTQVDVYTGNSEEFLGETTASPDTSGVLSVPVDYSTLPAGTYQLSINLSYTDSLGGNHPDVTITAPSVTSANTLQVTGGTTPIQFTATGDPNHDQIPLTYTLSLPATVTSTVTDSTGQVIDTLEQAVTHQSYYLSPSLIWDTLDHSQPTAVPAPAGTYHFNVSATDSGGKTVTFTQEIDLARPSAGTLTLTAGSDPSSYTVEFTPASNFTPTTVQLYATELGYSVSWLYQDPNNAGSWTGTLDTSNLANGTYHLYIQASPSSGPSLDTPSQTLTLANPEKLTSYSNGSLTLNPADPSGDEVFAGFGLAQPASVSGTVTDANGTTVAAIAAAEMGDGQVNSSQQLAWDGKYTVAGESGFVPDGTYTLTVSASDAAGGTDSFTVPVTVATVQPGSVTTPAAGTTIADSAAAVFTPAAAYAGEIGAVGFYADPQPTSYGGNPGTYLGAATVQPDGTWTATLDTSSLYDGAHALTADVQWSTSDGTGTTTYHSAAVPVVAFTETHTHTIKSLDKGAYLTPGVAGSDATSASLSFVLNRPATVNATITGPGSATTTVTTMTLGSLGYGSNTVSWNGLDSSGAAVPDGVYTLTLSAAANGSTETSTASFGVLNEAPGILTGPTSTVSGNADFAFSFATSAVDIADSWADLTIDSGQNSGQTAYDVGSGTAPSTGGSAYTWAVDTLSMYPGSYSPVQLPNGSHTADVVFNWTDVYGRSHVYDAPAAAAASFTVNNQLKFTTTPAPGAIEFNDDPQLATFSAPVGTTYATTGTAVVVAGTSPTGSVVRTLPGLSLSPAGTTVTWDGKDDSGQDVPAGNYLIHVTATDAVGTTGTQDIAVEVLAGAPGAITGPAAGSTVTGQQDLVWTPAGSVTTNHVYFTQDGQGLGEASAQPDGTYVLSADLSQLGDGSYTFGVQVDFQTPWGVTNGAYYTYHATESVMVDNVVGVSDLPASDYILPNSGEGSTYTGYYATTARGLSIVETVVPDGQTTAVRTYAAQTSIGQDPAGDCPEHRVTVQSGGSSSGYITYDCEPVSWDGRDDAGNVVPDGLYDIVLTVTGANGQTATGSIEVGVASEAPVVVTPADGSTVSDSATMTFAPAPGYPALLPGQSYPVPDPSGVTAVQTGYNSASVVTATSSLSTGDFSAVVDLPAGAVHGSFTMDSVVAWTDPFGVSHDYVVATPLQTDEHTLTLSDSESTSIGNATLQEGFQISSQAADGQPISYTITDGVTGDQAVTGTIPAPATPGGTYAPVTVPVSYHQAGTYTPEVVVTDAEGDRRHDFLPPITVSVAPPTAGLTLDRAAGVAPLVETATVTGSQSNGDPLTYTIDWGDGTVTSAAPLTGGQATVQHTYTDPSADANANGYRVVATVADGTLSDTAFGNVKVGQNVPLTAAVADSGGARTVNDGTVKFDAGVSQPALGITDYTWEYPPAPGVTCPTDPSAAKAAGCVVHDVGTDPTDSFSFPTPGNYDAVLVVTDPDQTPPTSSATEAVDVMDKTTTSISTLHVGLPGAIVKWADSANQVEQATDLGNGDYQLLGLPAGDTTVDVYLPGYQPAAATVTVQGLTGSGTVTLVPGGVGTVTTSVVRLNPTTAQELGVNLNDPANSNAFEVDASITINGPDGAPEPLNLTGAANDTGSLGFAWQSPNQPVKTCTSSCVIPIGGGRGVTADIAQVGPKDNPQKALIVVEVPIKGKVLKEFYDVSATIKNLAPAGSGFTFTDGQATIDLGSGLSLPDLSGGSQPATQTVSDIAAGDTQNVAWVVRGDQSGDWPVSIGYTGTLALDFNGNLTPVEQPQDIDLSSEPANVHVYGLTGLKMIIQVGPTVTAGMPFVVNVGMQNTTPDADYYNVSVSMQPPTATCPPGQQDPCWVHLVSPQGNAADPDPAPAGFADIGPGQTVYQQFQLLPTFSGQVDFSQSTAAQVAGQQMAQPEIQPLTNEPGSDSANPPTFDISAAPDGQDQLTWSADPNALGYDVYVSSDLSQGFGDPVASVAGSDTSTELAVPATTDAVRLGTAAPTPGIRLVASVAPSASPGIRLAAASLLHPDSLLQTLDKYVMIGTKLADGINFLHPYGKATPKYADDTVTDPVTGSQMKGMVNSKGAGLGWSTQQGQPLYLNGFEIDPSGSGYAELNLTNHTFAVHGSGSIGFSVAGGDPIPLYSYSQDFSWPLTKPFSLNLSTSNLLGMTLPAGATATVTMSGAGADLATTVSAPAMLGGASAKLDVSTSLSGGVQLKGASIDLGSVSIGQLAAGKVKLNYSGSATSSSWTVAGSLTAPGAAANDVTGTLTYDSSGNLTSGTSLSISDLSFVGLGTIKPLTLSTSDGQSWSGSGAITTTSGASAQGSFTYTVDPSTDTITKASVSVPNLSIPGLVTLTKFGLSYTGGDSPAWTVSGAGSGQNAPSVSGTLTVTDGQGISSGNLTLNNLTLGGIATVKSAALTYDATKLAISGNANVTLPGSSTNPQISVSIQGGVLQTLSASGVSFNIGAVSVTGGSFQWDPKAATYKLSATDANALNLGHLSQLDLSATAKGDTWTFSATGTITALGGSAGTLSGTISFAGGQVTDGSLTVNGLNIAGLAAISSFSVGYSSSKWTASLAGPNIGSGSIEIDLDSSGAITGGSLSLKGVNLGPAAIDLSASMDNSGNWSFSGDAKLADGSNSSDFTLSATYQDGTLQSASLGGHIALGKLLNLGLDSVSYDASTDTFAIKNGSITLPGPGGGTLTGSISITNGQFTSGSFGVQAGGSGVPLGDGIFLTGGSVTVQVSPTVSFGGQVTLAAGPQIPAIGAAALTGSVGLSYTDEGDGSGLYNLSGSLAVAGTQVGQAQFSYDTGANEAKFDGTFSVGVAAVAQLSAEVKGDFTADSFSLDGQLQGTLVNIPLVKNFISGSATGRLHLDNAGVSACAFLGNYSWQGGVSYQWGQTPQLFQGCDIGGFGPVGAAAQAKSLRGAVRAAALEGGAAPSTFSIASGQDVAVLKFVGTTAAPVVTLDGPDGEVFTTPADPSQDGLQQSGRYIVFQDSSSDTTYFLLNNPSAGTWTDTIDPGTPVSSLQAAAGLPLTTVTATLSGTGSSRTLGYSVSPTPAGQQVAFTESAATGTQQIGSPVSDGSGQITFHPLAGTDTHTISATVLMNGLVRTTSDLLTYSPAGGPVVTIPPVIGPPVGGTGGTPPGPIGGIPGPGPTGPPTTTRPTGPPTISTPPAGSRPSRDGKGYWLVGKDGSVYAFGSATSFGSLAGRPLASPVVGITATPDGRGYWLVGSDGGVFAFGDARFFGSIGGLPLASPVVGITVTPDGRGYWLVGSDGGVFAFGDARFFGSTGGVPLDRPVIAISPTPDGRGYTLTASDGGVFPFGDARFLGSTGGRVLDSPVVGGVGH